MKILLKDPSKVDAVIEKIDSIHPITEACANFKRYCTEIIKELIANGATILLEVEWQWSGERLESIVHYCPISEIPTDEQYLNDNGNNERV